MEQELCCQGHQVWCWGPCSDVEGCWGVGRCGQGDNGS